ncbi:hypothetical protein B0H19DRAFT_1273135 [Mycena capillaripes]|nr:hypothetical protein B0H19DRAFT_1273135 [Mycena capillaripes]
MADFQMPTPAMFEGLETDKRTKTLYKGFLMQDGILVGLAREVAGLKNELQQMRTEHSEGRALLKAAINVLVQTNGTQAVSGGTQAVKGSTKQARVAAPTVFKGDSDQVDQFLAECYLNFHNNPVYDNKTLKITFALSYMKEGSASIWANNVVQSMHNPTKDATIYHKYEDFEQAVIKAS